VRRILKVCGRGADYHQWGCAAAIAMGGGMGCEVSHLEKVWRNAGFVSIGNLARSN